jgi:hypothetical protein
MEPMLFIVGFTLALIGVAIAAEAERVWPFLITAAGLWLITVGVAYSVTHPGAASTSRDKAILYLQEGRAMLPLTKRGKDLDTKMQAIVFELKELKFWPEAAEEDK